MWKIPSRRTFSSINSFHCANQPKLSIRSPVFELRVLYQTTLTCMRACVYLCFCDVRWVYPLFVCIFFQISPVAVDASESIA